MGNSFSATMAKKYFPSFKESNYKVFQYMLYSNSKSNPMAKSYIEENAIMVGNASDGENRVPVSKSEPMTRPVVGYNKSTDKFQPYTVNFDFKQDNVDVN